MEHIFEETNRYTNREEIEEIQKEFCYFCEEDIEPECEIESAHHICECCGTTNFEPGYWEDLTEKQRIDLINYSVDVKNAELRSAS